MTKWLSIIGMGEDGPAGLSAASRGLVERAEIIVGSARLLAMLGSSPAEKHEWPTPFDAMVERIKGWKDRRVVVLATGDPLNFGVAARLSRHFFEEMEVKPQPSARLGWSLPDVETVSLHGRHDALIEPLIQPCARIIALTAGDATIRAAGRRLVARRYGGSLLTVLEHMGGPQERRTSFTATGLASEPFADFCTLAIECLPDPEAALLPRVPGLPDEAFVHDGQLTKREVRAATIAALGPVPGALLWDIGAGCGSVAIEWMRSARNARAIAFERNAARIQMIARNMDALGTPGLRIISGDAEEALKREARPDAVFHGGAVADGAIFAAAWEALHSGGRLVANAVTLEGESALIARQGIHGGDLVRMEISTLTHVGGKRALKPRMAVLQWRAVKP
jgi:precorrin-6B C5,15-methyltransferase / cobalt-precorrin-6B C5,C15-methyltransferase